MSLRYRWPEPQITELIEPAIKGTEARIRFDNIEEAERFRFACYNLRHRKGIGRGLSFILEKVEDQIEILVMQTPVFELKRVIEDQEQEQEQGQTQDQTLEAAES